MFSRISNGWALSKQSFRVLMLDKELLLFPIMSGFALPDGPWPALHSR